MHFIDLNHIREIFKTILEKVDLRKKELLSNALEIRHIANDMTNYISSLIPEVRKEICGHKFVSSEEEIIFFKEIKPSLIKELYYFTEIYNIEMLNERNSISSEVEYYQEVVDTNKISFTKKSSQCVYFELNRTDLDIIYFTRNQTNNLYHTDSFSSYLDPDFNTFQDLNYSKHLARKEISIYLKARLFYLKKISLYESTNLRPHGNMLWSGKKIKLIQLVYCIAISECVNDGKISNEELIEFFEISFNISLSNYNVSLNQLRNAKKDKFPFIKELLEKAIQLSEKY